MIDIGASAIRMAIAEIPRAVAADDTRLLGHRFVASFALGGP